MFAMLWLRTVFLRDSQQVRSGIAATHLITLLLLVHRCDVLRVVRECGNFSAFPFPQRRVHHWAGVSCNAGFENTWLCVC